MAIEFNKQASERKQSIELLSSVSRLRQHKISHKEIRFFTEQMALLLATGTNLHVSLKALQVQLQNPAMVQLVEDLAEKVAQGKQFSQALEDHSDVFSLTYINLIAASENGGFMHDVLEQLLEMEEKREQLRRTLFSALSYPLFLMLFALGVVVFVLVVVFPKFAEMFTMISDQLPSTTLFLMSSSEFILQYWVYLLVASLLMLIGFRYFALSKYGRYRLDWIKLNVPVIRSIYIHLYIMQSMRVLSLSLSNGVGILAALQSCKEVIQNSLFQTFIRKVEEHVEGGDGIAVGFSHVNFIPPVVKQMITTGEESGNLPKVMSKLSDFYEREITAHLQTFSRLAEPIMLLIMGVVVGLLVSSLILPIFKLSRAVG